MLEKCFHCTYDGDELSAPCAFHAANPDETTHEGVVAAAPATALEQLELAIEPQGPPAVIGEQPCDACTRGAFCSEHSGKTRRPYVAPTVTERPITDEDLAVLVDEAPKTPRDRGTK